MLTRRNAMETFQNIEKQLRSWLGNSCVVAFQGNERATGDCSCLGPFPTPSVAARGGGLLIPTKGNVRECVREYVRGFVREYVRGYVRGYVRYQMIPLIRYNFPGIAFRRPLARMPPRAFVPVYSPPTPFRCVMSDICKLHTVGYSYLAK